MKNEEKHCKWYNDEFCTNADSPCVADYCPCVEYPELCKCRELDNGENLANSVANEKKLTDEEIVKALEYCSGEKGVVCSIDCPAYGLGVGTVCQDKIIPYALDLIHRLQSENKRLKKQVEQGLKDMKLEVGVRDKEIQRLTREKTESAKTAVEVLEQNIELQKQVDDLKEHQVIECYGMLKGCDMVKQAVKDTAKEFSKEICRALWNRGKTPDGKVFDYGDLTSIDVWDIAKEKFGVEVE